MAKGSGQFKQSKRLRRHYVTKVRITRYGFHNFARNMWLTVAATAVMTITLLILFVTLVASQVLTDTVNETRNKVDISIYFKAETSDDTLRNLAGKMRVLDNVREVSISNSQAEYEKLIDMYKDDPSTIEAISSIEGGIQTVAIMRIKVNDINNLDSVKNLVDNDKLFQEWLDGRRAPTYAGDQQDAVNTISKWLNFAQRGGLVAGAVFLLISFLVIFNTIRMAIFSRHDEIDMMKAIGADRHFIRGPFLVEAEMYGFFAAMIAVAIGYAGFMWVSPGLESYGVRIGPARDLLVEWWPVVILGMLAAGMLIGYISARMAVRRYLSP